MRGILFTVALIVAIGVVVSRSLDNYLAGTANSSVLAIPAAARAPAPAESYRTVMLQSDGRGHFQVEARVDGRAIDFLLDTGATMIALRESSAARLGIHPSERDYKYRTQTANGVGRAARVVLSRVEVNGITVRDVDAFVMPDELLAVNLLGMSFLSRVKWSHNRGRLVLEQ
jgi:aspartyl protease family protein